MSKTYGLDDFSHALDHASRNDTTPALVSALYELARHVDEDVPVEHRTRHLTNALSYAFELVEAFEELPTQP